MQPAAGDQIGGVDARGRAVPVVDHVLDDLGFFFQGGQHPAPEHLRADHRAEIALQHGHPGHREAGMAIAPLVHAGRLAQRVPDLREDGAGADHRPVNRLRSIPQIHAQPLRAAHRRQQIHVGVQIDGLNQHLACQTLGRAPVQRNHALPERMLGLQAQRQGFVPVLHVGNRPIGLARILAPEKLRAGEDRDLVGAEAGEEARDRFARVVGRLGAGKRLVNDRVYVAEDSLAVAVLPGRQRAVPGRGDAHDGAIQHFARKVGLPAPSGFGEVRFEGQGTWRVKFIGHR